MGFADVYLLKAGLREALFEPEPHSDLKLIVTIPVYNESGLERCLDSLLLSARTLPDSVHAEVLILINAPAEAPSEVLEQNRHTLASTQSWMAHHPHPAIDFHVLLDHSFGKKEAGVGLARKILMDEAVRRLDQIGLPGGIIASMDADAVVDANYLEALSAHFKLDQKGPSSLDARMDLPEGCSIYFEHPLSPNDSPDSLTEDHTSEIYQAIAQYELHLRYYLQSVRHTGYPYAYHTVGSAFAVRAGVYGKEGGMNRRQGGEDFYFIQKVAQRGKFSECNTTRVVPSPRPSDRVPFGTGPVVDKLIRSGEMLTTYDPRPFQMLKQLFTEMERLYTDAGVTELLASAPPVLKEFLESQKFSEALKEIRRNSASYPAFQKRFWRWFTMFRIMKFLHFARERGFPDVPVEEAARKLLNEWRSTDSIVTSRLESKELLKLYRKLERP